MASQSVFQPARHEIFVCDCGDVNHQFVVSIDKNEIPPDIYVEVKLNRYLPFWRRLVNAIRYLFKVGSPSRFGDYECVLLNKSHAEGLQRVVNLLNLRKD